MISKNLFKLHCFWRHWKQTAKNRMFISNVFYWYWNSTDSFNICALCYVQQCYIEWQNEWTHTHQKMCLNCRLFHTILAQHVLWFWCQNSAHILVSFFYVNFLYLTHTLSLSRLNYHVCVYNILFCFCFALRAFVF